MICLHAIREEHDQCSGQVFSPVRNSFGLSSCRGSRRILRKRSRRFWSGLAYIAWSGPVGDGFTGKEEGDEVIKELTGQVVISICDDVIERIESAATERKAGRPCDMLTRVLGPRLLDMFLRYNSVASRHSVLTSRDGKLVQEETGPLFWFFEVAIKPINDCLRELNWKPISAGRLARYALAKRRRSLQARKPRAIQRHRLEEEARGL